MHIIDSHFHWRPRSLLEWACKSKGYPRAERDGQGGYVWMIREGYSVKIRPDHPAWAPLEDQPAPGNGPLLDVGAHHQRQAPMLVVGSLDGGIEQNPATLFVQAQAEFDVLDAGAVVGGRIEATEGEEPLPAHRPQPGPETCGGAGLAAVGVVM